jgi:hypothetical protein
VAAVVAEADVVWRVGESHARLLAGEHPIDVCGQRGVADQEPMFAQGPQVSWLDPRSPGRFL